LATFEEVDRFVADMISHVLRGELDPKIASTVGYLLSIQLKVKRL